MKNPHSDLHLNIAGSLLVGLLFCYLFSGDSDREATAREVFTNFLSAFSFYTVASFLAYRLVPRPIITCVVAAGIGSFLFSSYLILPLVHADSSLLEERVAGILLYTVFLSSVAAPLLAITHLLAFVLRQERKANPFQSP